MDAGEFFAVGWPELVPRLRSMLARAGAPGAERDDLVQETALRLLGMWGSVDPARPVEPLARRIAMNAWRDQWRRLGEREVLGEVPELAAEVDTERAALARVEVGEVSRALSALPVGTAEVLRLAAAEFEGGGPRVAVTASVRMARTRARRALAACLKVASAVVLAALAGVRWLTRPVTVATGVGALAAFACMLALAVPGPGAGPALQRESEPLGVAPAAMPQAGTVSQASRASTAAVTAARHARPVASPTPYYVVGAGPTRVGVFADVDIDGHGVRLAKPGAGSAQPVCGYGDTPATVITPSCSKP